MIHWVRPVKYGEHWVAELDLGGNKFWLPVARSEVTTYLLEANCKTYCDNVNELFDAKSREERP